MEANVMGASIVGEHSKVLRAFICCCMNISSAATFNGMAAWIDMIRDTCIRLDPSSLRLEPVLLLVRSAGNAAFAERTVAGGMWQVAL
jgi:hypothetical protein